MDTVLLMDITSIAREILINVKHKLDHFVVSVGPDFFGRCEDEVVARAKLLQWGLSCGLAQPQRDRGRFYGQSGCAFC